MKKRSDKENFREFIINIFKGLDVSLHSRWGTKTFQ
jgi:hypothetical protein